MCFKRILAGLLCLHIVSHVPVGKLRKALCPFEPSLSPRLTV